MDSCQFSMFTGQIQPASHAIVSIDLVYVFLKISLL